MGAFWWYRGLHLLTVACLVALGVWMELGVFYYAGVGIATALLAYEHTLVKPGDLSKLNRAFFTVNSYVAVALLAFTMLEVLL